MRVEENRGGGLAIFFPSGTALTDLGFLLMRLMVGTVFITSGWSDLRNPDARSKSIGMSKGFTIFLGASEVLGSLGVMAGVLTQWAALGLNLDRARCHPEKNLCMALGVLGRKDPWLALRPDAGVNEPGDSVHQGWELGAFEVG
jgi:hypothetical protein